MGEPTEEAPAEMSLTEAIAVQLAYQSRNKNKAIGTILARARRVMDREAEAIMGRETGGLCTECWGDGFHRVGTAMLSGPCHVCSGTGRRASNPGGA